MTTLDFDDAIAPPMVNGEVQFAQPWHGRVFGMARTLCEAGLYSWDEFREALIAQLANGVSAEDEFEYYNHFQLALEQLLASKSLVLPNQLAQLSAEYAQRPHGHDHHHSLGSGERLVVQILDQGVSVAPNNHPRELFA